MTFVGHNWHNRYLWKPDSIHNFYVTYIFSHLIFIGSFSKSKYFIFDSDNNPLWSYVTVDLTLSTSENITHIHCLWIIFLSPSPKHYSWNSVPNTKMKLPSYDCIDFVVVKSISITTSVSEACAKWLATHQSSCNFSSTHFSGHYSFSVLLDLRSISPILLGFSLSLHAVFGRAYPSVYYISTLLFFS